MTTFQRSTFPPLRGAQSIHFRSQGRRASRLPLATFFRTFGASFCFLLLTVHCSLLTASAASWSRQTTGTMSWLHGVYFLDQNRGWAAGSGGTLLETIDGGQSWRKLNTLTRDNLNDVYFANEKIGWLVAECDILKLKTNDEPRTYLLKTEDGGFSWRRVLLNGSGDNVRLVRAVFADANRGWVFGETGVVFATRDGGANWARQTSPTKHLLLGGVFVDHSHGWLVGAGATILQTNDGGLNWRTANVRDGAGTRFTAASFVGSSLGWAVGTAGRIFSTTDGGRTWFEQSSNVEADLSDVKFIDASEGWAVGTQGTLLQTRDSGIHWAPTASGTSHPLERLFFIDRNHGWAVGFGGTVLNFSQAGAPRLKS
ncbi:MAG: hypothetical protein QOD83_5042 [Solirubrobacteraceae bacterium]|nr:hypothetical protein [Solirubrobacteraceae bacterium]